MEGKSLQEEYAPRSICFGCGPANEQGLQIRSFVEGDQLVAVWQPESYHQAFPGVLNGGIIGALLDCHCNWTAAWHLMKTHTPGVLPCTVTADYAIKLKRPTPTDVPLYLTAVVQEAKDNKVVVTGELTAKDKVCASCVGTFVAVGPDHPGFHRW